MERKLASIRVISELLPIEGADKIELAIIDGWKVVVAKDVGHKVGDIVDVNVPSGVMKLEILKIN